MNKVDLSSYQNKEYKPGNKLKLIFWYFVNLWVFKTSFPWPSTIKTSVLKWFGAQIGQGVVIKPNVNIKYPWFLKIGSHVWIGEEVWIDNLSQVDIGNNVCLSQGAMLLCGNHNYKKTTFDLMTKPIIINDGAWVGAKSVVGPGVVIGSHAILSVASFSNMNLEPFKIYQGVPAKFVRDREIS